MKRIFLSLFLATALVCQLAAKIAPTKIYMFGVCTSFKDSVNYITDIQEIEGAYLDTKTKFLADRVAYSDQLHTYTEVLKGIQHPTCAVFYNVSKEKLQKEYLQVKKRYQENNTILKDLIATEFRFQVPNYASKEEKDKEGQEP